MFFNLKILIIIKAQIHLYLSSWQLSLKIVFKHRAWVKYYLKVFRTYANTKVLQVF